MTITQTTGHQKKKKIDNNYFFQWRAYKTSNSAPFYSPDRLKAVTTLLVGYFYDPVVYYV